MALIDYGARFCKPWIGRFIQPDPIAPQPAALLLPAGSVFAAFAASRDSQWRAVAPCALAGQRDCPEAPNTEILNLATDALAHTLPGQRVVTYTPDGPALVTDAAGAGGRIVTSLWRAGRWEAYAQLAAGLRCLIRPSVAHPLPPAPGRR